ncbi:MAG: hypothetical protein U9M92_01875 [Patescibacteria group bacterium]|nr:hypothetical protein [Patescibacteria group bacterium]
MFSWSVRRRVIYLLIAIVIVAGLAAAVAWQWRPIPSCSDGHQNQDEVGIDCGGSCERVCSSEIRSLRVVWTRILEVGPGQYDTATLVVNPNRQHGAERFHYLVRFLDSQGILVGTRTGEAFINPGESLIIYNGRLGVGQRAPTQAILEITDNPLWRRATAEVPPLDIQITSFVNTPFPRLIAELTNPTLGVWFDVSIVALLSDSGGNAFAVSSTVVDRLEAQSSVEVAFTWPRPFAVADPTISFYPQVSLSAEPPLN